MRPLLEACEIGKEHNASEMVRKLAPRFSLTQEDLSKRHDKSKSLIFQGRIGWAKVYLQKAGLLESKSRGYFSINDEGVQFLKTHNEVHNESLCSLAKFREWKYPEKESILLNETPRMDLTIVDLENDPQESMEEAYRVIRKELKDKLLSNILEQNPSFFEKLVLDVILSLGYGDSFSSGEILGKSSDGGVDGVIPEF